MPKIVGASLDFVGATRIRNLLPAVSGDEPQRKAEAGSGGSGGGFSYGSTAPASPAVGDRWVDSTTGALFTYIDDGSSSQWVEL